MQLFFLWFEEIQVNAKKICNILIPRNFLRIKDCTPKINYHFSINYIKVRINILISTFSADMKSKGKGKIKNIF